MHLKTISQLVWVNSRIRNEICNKTLERLTDPALLPVYATCFSVKNEIAKLKSIFAKEDISTQTQENILRKYMLALIPAGTKGVIRGNMFNQIVREFIQQLPIEAERFDRSFEKKHDANLTAEIPDWYIFDRQTNKILIGMNQLDLWNGGQQLNRGYKYLVNNPHNNSNSKLLCVVCNYVQFKSQKNKAYRLFEIGFENNTLCYLNNLPHIINEFFNP